MDTEQRFIHTTFYSGRSRCNIRRRGTLQAEGSIAGPRTQASEAPLFTRIWYDGQLWTRTDARPVALRAGVGVSGAECGSSSAERDRNRKLAPGTIHGPQRSRGCPNV